MPTLVELLTQLKKHKRKLDDRYKEFLTKLSDGRAILLDYEKTNELIQNAQSTKECPLVVHIKTWLKSLRVDRAKYYENTITKNTDVNLNAYHVLLIRAKIRSGGSKARAILNAIDAFAYLETHEALEDLMMRVEREIILRSLLSRSLDIEDIGNQICTCSSVNDETLSTLTYLSGKGLDVIKELTSTHFAQDPAECDMEKYEHVKGLKEALKVYKIGRSNIKDEYYHCLSSVFGGYSKKDKLSVVEKLIGVMHGGPALTALEIKVLKQGELGKIVKPYEDLLRNILNPSNNVQEIPTNTSGSSNNKHGI